jgi:antirestriction protein ArdC
VVLWKTGTKNETDPETGDKIQRQALLARMFTVFNAEQADGLPERYQGPARGGQPVAEIRDAQQAVDGYLQHGGPQLRHVSGDRAYYSTGDDMVTVPTREQFKTAAAYYSTVFHELGHSTGHKDRQARESLVNFSHERRWGDALYAKEELVAEMTNAMLAAETGIETDHEFEQSAAYIQSWLRELERDPKLVPQAAAAAQRAADLITERQRQTEKDTEPERELEAA